MLQNENEIIESVINGDDVAFEKLVNHYGKPIYNFIYRLTNDRSSLDDISQETFIKAWKNISQFNRSKKFKTWIFTIAKNNALDHLKKKRPALFSSYFQEDDQNPLENLPAEEDLPNEILLKDELSGEIETLLDKMPELYRVILIMHYKNDFSLTEISEILEKPYNTIKSQHQRALRTLKNIIRQSKLHPK